MHMHREVRNVESFDAHIPAEVEQDGALLSHFSSPTINDRPFCSLFRAMLFTFLCFFVGDFAV